MILFNVYANNFVLHCTLPISLDVSKIDNFDTDGEIINLIKFYSNQLKDFLEQNYKEELILPSLKLSKFRKDIEELEQQKSLSIKCKKKMRSIMVRKDQNYKNLEQQLAPLKTLTNNFEKFQNLYFKIFQSIEAAEKEYEEKIGILNQKWNIERNNIQNQFDDFKKSKDKVNLQRSTILKPFSKTINNLNNLSMEDIEYFFNLTTQRKLPEIPNSIILRKISSIIYFINRKNHKKLDDYFIYLSEEFMDKMGQFYLAQNTNQIKIIIDTIHSMIKQHLNSITTLHVVEKNEKYIRANEKLLRNKMISNSLITISKEIKSLYTDKEKLIKFIEENEKASQAVSNIKNNPKNTLNKKSTLGKNNIKKPILNKTQLDARFTVKQLEEAIDKKLIIKDLMLAAQDLQKKDVIHYISDKIIRQIHQKFYINQYIFFLNTIIKYHDITKYILENIIQETINDDHYFINIKKIERLKELRAQKNMEAIIEELSANLTEEDLMSIDSDTPRFELQKKMAQVLDDIIIRNHRIFQDNKPMIKMDTSVESNKTAFKKIELKQNNQIDQFTKNINMTSSNRLTQNTKIPVINMHLNNKGNEISFGQITFKKINPNYLESNYATEEEIESHHQKVEKIINNKYLQNNQEQQIKKNIINKKQFLQDIDYKKIDRNNFMETNQNNELNQKKILSRTANIEQHIVNDKTNNQNIVQEKIHSNEKHNNNNNNNNNINIINNTQRNLNKKKTQEQQQTVNNKMNSEDKHLMAKINYRKTNIKNPTEIKSKIKEYKEQLLKIKKDSQNNLEKQKNYIEKIPSFTDYLNTRLKPVEEPEQKQLRQIKLTQTDIQEIKKINNANNNFMQQNHAEKDETIDEILFSPIKNDPNNNINVNTFRSLEQSSTDFQKYISPEKDKSINININVSNLNQSIETPSEPIPLNIFPAQLSMVNGHEFNTYVNAAKMVESEYFNIERNNNQHFIETENKTNEKQENNFIIRKAKKEDMVKNIALDNIKKKYNINTQKQRNIEIKDIEVSIDDLSKEIKTEPNQIKQKDDRFIMFYDSGYQNIADVNKQKYNTQSTGFRMNQTSSMNSSTSSKRDEILQQISKSFAEYDNYYNKI